MGWRLLGAASLRSALFSGTLPCTDRSLLLDRGNGPVQTSGIFKCGMKTSPVFTYVSPLQFIVYDTHLIVFVDIFSYSHDLYLGAQRPPCASRLVDPE